MSYEFCEYQSKEGVIYAEPRYCPHLLIPHILDEPEIDFLGQKNSWTSDSSHKITTESVVEAVNKGLKRGQEDFGIVTRTILSCIRGKPEWSEEILNLCIKFRDSGVVGIDIAGDEAGEGTIKEEDQGKICVISQYHVHSFFCSMEIIIPVFCIGCVHRGKNAGQRRYCCF